MQSTKIEWTDMSWNPVTGCKHNCSYCYASQLSRRFGRSFEPQFHADRLIEPCKITKSKKIFVGSMADIFGAWVPSKWIFSILDIVKKNPQHIFQFLTKNPERYDEFTPFPGNVWIGASVTNETQLKRARKLNATASIRYISAEPLLNPIRLNLSDKFDWVIIGAQTGPKKFQPPVDWVENLTQDARDIGAAVLYKPNLLGYKNPPRDFPKISLF